MLMLTLEHHRHLFIVAHVTTKTSSFVFTQHLSTHEYSDDMQSMFASYVHSAQTDVYIPLDCANGQGGCCCTCKAGG